MLKIAAGVSALVAVVVVIVLLVYGSSDDPPPPAQPQAQATPADTPTGTPPPIQTLLPSTVIVRLDDKHITAAKSSIKAADGKITLALVNQGVSPLRFVLARGKPQGADAISTARVAEFPLKAAEVQNDQVDVKPGEYTLIVRASDTSPAESTTTLRVR